MKWLNMKSLVASAGNPFAFLALLFIQIPGTIIGGHYFHISLFGVVVLIAFGYVYFGAFILLRMLVRQQDDLLVHFGKISDTTYPLSVIGLMFPVLCLTEMEANVFGFIILPIVFVFAAIMFFVSLYAICRK
ncbi:hypothetical protein Ga0466249_004852 [Sporomusaceae bacterium BoRhaA]|uniref:hypothetical protein n=1 Tax=Pelorhabdus rhamnosifermentans TaxID=2772457 RepID=UPI001C0646D9|nr:hypothetical protein [Pelorhabdus rhamnosifermentans]MBU2703704.1 hypothetical protein [Pelorhabdus rhamnosifermentans]